MRAPSGDQVEVCTSQPRGRVMTVAVPVVASMRRRPPLVMYPRRFACSVRQRRATPSGDQTGSRQALPVLTMAVVVRSAISNIDAAEALRT
jgi:hypothetical protein